jgi:hypothetical protein
LCFRPRRGSGGRAGGQGPCPPGCFQAINVKAVDLDGDGVFDLLIFTAVRKGKTQTAFLPA